MAITGRKLDLYEIFEEFEKKKTKKEKIELLQQYNIASVTDYLRCVFDERIQFNLPEGRPPFEAASEESPPSNWHRQNAQLKFFVKGLQGDRLQAYKRESIYIGVLESVHPKDAELLVEMIRKKTPVKGLTKKLVQEAFPNIIK